MDARATKIAAGIGAVFVVVIALKIWMFGGAAFRGSEGYEPVRLREGRPAHVQVPITGVEATTTGPGVPAAGVSASLGGRLEPHGGSDGAQPGGLHSLDLVERRSAIDHVMTLDTQLSAEADMGADVARDRSELRAQLLAAATSERDPLSISILLPFLASQEVEISRPLLEGYLNSGTLPTEQTAAVVETLLETGGWTASAAAQWFSQRSATRGDLAEVLEELGEALPRDLLRVISQTPVRQP